MNLNQVVLAGRLGHKPEAKKVGDTTVSNFSLATSERWNDKAGNKQERTEWHKCVVWGASASNLAEYCDKGDVVLVSGKIQTRVWQNKEGKDVREFEIHCDRVQWQPKKRGHDDSNEPAL